MRKLKPEDSAANLRKGVKMSLFAIPPSLSWYPSRSELLCRGFSVGLSQARVPHPCRLLPSPSPPENPVCLAGSTVLLMNRGKYQPAGVRWLTQGPKLQTPPQFRSAFLLWWSAFYNAVPAVTWTGESELWVVGPSKVAPAKVHQAQLSGEDDEWWEAFLRFVDVI